MQPKTKTILFIIFSFLLGGVCGTFVSIHLVTRRTQPITSHREFLKVFRDRVKLSDYQVEQADSLFDISKKKMDVYRNAMLQIRDSARADVKKILNPNQIVLFDQFIQEITDRGGRWRTNNDEDTVAVQKHHNN